MTDTYTNRLFNNSVQQINDLFASGLSINEISNQVKLSESLVSAMIEKYVEKEIPWDHYSGLPSPKAYE